MDIPASNWDGTSGRGPKRLTNYGTTKYDLGQKACGPNEKIRRASCTYFFSGRCLAGNRCSHSHNQTPLNFNNYKPDDRSECMESQVYIAPAREGSEWNGTVSGPDIAAAPTSQYDPVTDSLDLVNSIIAEEEIKSLRAFKFALVEIVKELLSPTWKKQQIDKETYKKIVEKVVNKVMSSVQSRHIPQTQENIKSYLAVSKPNISKLIEAYITKEKANVA